jgi:hypothetical protein
MSFGVGISIDGVQRPQFPTLSHCPSGFHYFFTHGIIISGPLPYLSSRLSFAADPLEILRACPTNLVFLCLQYCPVHNVLYACTGLRTPAEEASAGRKSSVMAPKGAPAPAPAAKGAPAAAPVVPDNSPVKDAFWVIDKVWLLKF